MASKSVPFMQKGLDLILINFKQRGFAVRSVLVDGESSVKALESCLQAKGIGINLATKGEHVPEVERAARMIKERYRSVIWSTPYSAHGGRAVAKRGKRRYGARTCTRVVAWRTDGTGMLRSLVRRVCDGAAGWPVRTVAWAGSPASALGAWSCPPVLTQQLLVRGLASKKPTTLVNEQITAPSLRVVYVDLETGKKEHQIMTRKEALAFAKKRDLDLVAMNMESDPPVCKLDNFSKVVVEASKRERSTRANNRATSVKEVQMIQGIASHDLATKMRRIKGFTRDGHPVKLVLLPRRRKRPAWVPGKPRKQYTPPSNDELVAEIDDLMLKVLTEMENEPVGIQHKDLFKEVPVGSVGKRKTFAPKQQLHQKKQKGPVVALADEAAMQKMIEEQKNMDEDQDQDQDQDEEQVDQLQDEPEDEEERGDDEDPDADQDVDENENEDEDEDQSDLEEDEEEEREAVLVVRKPLMIKFFTKRELMIVPKKATKK